MGVLMYNKDWAALIVVFLLVAVISLAGCKTAAVIDTASSIRGKIAEKELEAHVRGACSGNFDEVLKRFGKSSNEWNAILTICGIGQNKLDIK